MLPSLKTRTTDLGILRSMLLNEEYTSTQEKNENNEEHNESSINNVENIDNLFTPNTECLDLNVKEQNTTRLISKPKKRDDESPVRQPFFVGRINSHHKDNSNVLKVRDNEIPLQSGATVYKSVHYKNILQKEEKLQNKYRQLAEILQKDVVARTAAICDQSMNEARQLIQNSLATSRIISSFVSDNCNSGFIHKTPEIIELPISTTNDSLFVNECHTSITNVQPLMENQSHTQDPFQPTACNTITEIHGYEVTSQVRDFATRAATEHRLESDEPFIQNWLLTKEREEREKRRLENHQWKIERAVTMNAERVLEQRKAASEEAFKTWCRRKSQDARKVVKVLSNEVRSLSPDSSDEDSLPQAGRQPRPIHNFVYRRPQSLTRPKTAATFTIRTDIKMKLTGHKVDLAVSETSRPMNRLQLSGIPGTMRNLPRPQTAMPGRRNNVSRPQQDFTRSVLDCPGPQSEKAPSNTLKLKLAKSTNRRSRRRRSKVTRMGVHPDDQENTNPRPMIGVDGGDNDTAKVSEQENGSSVRDDVSLTGNFEYDDDDFDLP